MPFDIATSIPPPSQSTPQPRWISFPRSSGTKWLQEPLESKIAGAVAILQAEPERIIGDIIFRRDLGRDQQLHRVDLLQGMPRQVVGVIAAHEAGIGPLARRLGEHPEIERGRLGLVDAFLLGVAGGGPSGRDRQRRAGSQRHIPAMFHETRGHFTYIHPLVAPQAILTQREALRAGRVNSWSRQARGTFNGSAASGECRRLCGVNRAGEERIMHNKTLITLLIGVVTTGLSGSAGPGPAAPLFATTKVEGTDNVYIFRYGNHQAMFIVTKDG